MKPAMAAAVLSDEVGTRAAPQVRARLASALLAVRAERCATGLEAWSDGAVADAALAARLAEVAMAVVREVVREAVIALLCGPGGGAK